MMKSLIISLACLLALQAYAASAAQCTFDILVKTGDRKNAGTDARISLQLRGASGRKLEISSLKAWGGKMGAGHDYFERGNLDRFRGTGPCLTGTPCNLVLSSSGSGNKPGWYVSYVQVTQVGQGSGASTTRRWKLEQWLAVTAAPHELSTVRNDCSFPAATALP
ncbi:hypothetical protein EJB05_38256, partial [Eragrostis curvula]